MLQSVQLISRLGTSDMKAGSYRRGTTQASVTLRASWRQRCEERQASELRGPGQRLGCTASLFKHSEAFFLLPQHAETFESQRGLSEVCLRGCGSDGTPKSGDPIEIIER